MPLQGMLNAQDEAHLKLISVFHYVLAGLYLLGIGFVILHFMIMSMVFRMAEAESMKTPATPQVVVVEPGSGIEIAPEIPPAPIAPVSPKTNPFPKEFMPIMYGVYGFIGLFLVALCVCNIVSGLSIRKRKRRIFSFVIAGVNCMQFPFGTALGVFTFIVLSRESVKADYASRLTA
jgi:hypothetical protein